MIICTNGLIAKVRDQLPGIALIDPYQWGMEHQALVHAQVKRQLHRLYSVVPAIGIAREVGLAHAANNVPDPSAISDGGSEGQKQKIAAR
jgi:hypothetical protein